MIAEQENLRKWLDGNKLTLYVAQTSNILGTNRKKHQTNSGELIKVHFKMSGEAIEQKKILKRPRSYFGNKFFFIRKVYKKMRLKWSQS